MIAHLLTPEETAERIAAQVAKDAAQIASDAVTGAPPVEITRKLRPGISGPADVRRAGYGAWQGWTMAWKSERRFDLRDTSILSSEIKALAGDDSTTQPLMIRVVGVDAIRLILDRFGYDDVRASLDRAVSVAERLRTASAIVNAGTVGAVCKLGNTDFTSALHTVEWLSHHPDLSDWTQRQLPVPETQSKWIAEHDVLLRRLSGRVISSETRIRPAVVHLTYADPEYLKGKGRQHDSWTSGDNHELPYVPTTVIVVENRDCRLWCPPTTGAIVVEGAGTAVGAVASIPWVRDARRLVYWGDMDAAGFAILDQFRRALGDSGPEVESLLMDASAWEKHHYLGVNHDAAGNPLQPSGVLLGALTAHEAHCYALLDSIGAEVRRIEQERISPPEVAQAVRALLGR